jgi:peptidoglycan hydrolase CwlO-like protein
MSKNIISFLILNGITTSIVTYICDYCINTFRVKSEINNKNKLDILLKKINTLENTIQELQEYVEEIEFKIDRKNNKVIESHTELSSKLENYINCSYDVYD